MIVLILSMLFSVHRPAYYGPIYCGPMYDTVGHFDHVTSECVGKVLVLGRRALVGVVCRDGAPALVAVWLDANGELDMDEYADVCAGHMQTTDGGTD